MILAWLAAIAGARPLELHASPGARVVLLQRTQPDFVELGVYGNRAPLGVEVARWTDPALVLPRVVDVGGGTMFVLLEVDEKVVAHLVSVGPGVWRVELAPGQPVIHEEFPVPTIDELLAGVPRRLAPEPEMSLTPLLRDARTYSLPVTAVDLDVPAPDLRPPPGWEALAEVPSPTLADIERWRKLLPTVEDHDLQVLLYWRLGTAHEALGLEREAAHYYALGEGVGFPPAAMFLRHAGAALKVGDPEVARAACRQAWYRDADPEQVLGCLGLLALATRDPAPAATGRALAQVATTPTSMLLAGELLLRDGFAAEAVQPLESAVSMTVGPNQDLARLALGDAYLVLGNLDRAHEAYQSAPHRALAPFLAVREVMVRMLRDGVRRWPAWVPQLSALAERGGPAGADALYLLAQVHERYVDWESSAAVLAELWERYPEVRDSDVGARLLADCGRRIAELDDGTRDAELVAVYDACWRPGLQTHVSDVAFLAAASRAFERLGLADQALGVQLELTTILAAGTSEDPLQLGRLAHLQVLTGTPERALETLEYTRHLSPPRAVARRLDLDAAEALTALGKVDEAVAAYRSAAADPELAETATRRLGVLELRHDRCEQALPILRDRLVRAPFPEEPGGELELLMVRCAVQLGRAPDAIEAAQLAVSRAADPWTPKEARWLATAIALRTGAALPDDLRSDAATLEAVRAEDLSQAEFVARIRAWQDPGRSP